MSGEGVHHQRDYIVSAAAAMHIGEWTMPAREYSLCPLTCRGVGLGVDVEPRLVALVESDHQPTSPRSDCLATPLDASLCVEGLGFNIATRRTRMFGTGHVTSAPGAIGVITRRRVAAIASLSPGLLKRMPHTLYKRQDRFR